MKNEKGKLDPRTSIGHVHLKVSDIAESLKFYHGVLGFEITTRMGEHAVFLAVGGYHHYIGLNTWESKGGKQPEQGTTGLYHFAILMPTRKELAKMVRRLMDHDWPLDGAADHGVSEAIYLQDPDGNGIEIYADRPRKEWKYDAKGNIIMGTERLDMENLLKEAD